MLRVLGHDGRHHQHVQFAKWPAAAGAPREETEMQRRYITVDVFTDRAFGGNPLAVVLDAGGLSTAQMQAIATEFNYSETTFVLPPRDASHDAEVRIFTPVREIPFAGHPNVGTAFVLATLAKEPKQRLLFEEKAGLVPVDILRAQGRVVSAELTAPQALARLSRLSAGDAASCVSLTAEDVRINRHEPQIVGVGTPFVVMELQSREALRRAKPDAAAFGRQLPRDGAFAVYFYTRDVPASEAPCDLQARMFFPGASGLIEDPATGSATVAAAALLAELDPAGDSELKLTMGQGFDMGRPSILLTRVRKRDGGIVSAHVGGQCVQMMEGTLRLAGEG
jgi:trans-2,3-dihydro-3-hydroxyanthranilate isomerase